MDRDEAIRKALQVLQSQGGRPSRTAIEALVDDLLAGGSPKTYGERLVQMTLQMQGFIKKEERNG